MMTLMNIRGYKEKKCKGKNFFLLHIIWVKGRKERVFEIVGIDS